MKPWQLLSLLLLILSIPIGCETFKFKECKKVGHSTLYCTMKLLEDDNRR